MMTINTLGRFRRYEQKVIKTRQEKGALDDNGGEI